MQTNQQFLLAFKQGLILKEEWTHEAHIRMGWLYLNQHGSWQVALPLVRCGIQHLNQAYGNLTGYHETLTVAFLRIINARIVRHVPMITEPDWDRFKSENPDLFDRRLMLRYYQPETLLSGQARQEFVPPDCQCFPDE